MSEASEDITWNVRPVAFAVTTHAVYPPGKAVTSIVVALVITAAD